MVHSIQHLLGHKLGHICMDPANLLPQSTSFPTQEPQWMVKILECEEPINLAFLDALAPLTLRSTMQWRVGFGRVRFLEMAPIRVWLIQIASAVPIMSTVTIHLIDPRRPWDLEILRPGDPWDLKNLRPLDLDTMTWTPWDLETPRPCDFHTLGLLCQICQE